MKFKNISADDKVLLVDAGRKPNGEPYAQYRIMHVGQTLEVTGEALKGASGDPDLRMVVDDEVKTLETNIPGVETKIMANEAAPKKRGRPKLLR